jgi:DNA-3-methyladenine glycosylase II
MAARAINNRFRGLFGYSAEDEEGFPSPADVAQKDVLVLKSAGLSLRKAEYGESGSLC